MLHRSVGYVQPGRVRGANAGENLQRVFPQVFAQLAMRWPRKDFTLPTVFPTELHMTKSLPGNAVNPKGIPQQRPRAARLQASLGNQVKASQPQRDCARPNQPWARPRWGWLVQTRLTQGSSQARNPGLEDTIPSGLHRTAAC